MREDRVSVVLACVLGLLVCSLAVHWRAKAVYDFTGFYIGAELLGTDKLYDTEANLAMQEALVGITQRSTIFVRPPFFAAAIKPLTLLPYRAALIVFIALGIIAMVGFVAVFPLCSRWHTALAVCWSLPAACAADLGQDAPLLALLMAVSILAWMKKRPVVAGMMLGACIIKFHLLIFLPMLLFRRKYRKVLAGFSVSVFVAVAVSFVVQPNWVQLYWRALVLLRIQINGTYEAQPNVYRMFAWTGMQEYAVIIAVLGIGVLLWRICCKCPFELAMPLCVVGALVGAHHSYYADAVVLLPSMLAVAAGFPSLVKWVALVLSPIAAVTVILPFQGGFAATVVIPCVYVIWRVSAAPPSSFAVPEVTSPLHQGDAELRNSGDRVLRT